MFNKITTDVIEGYLNCKYKGYLKLCGLQGVKSEYDIFNATLKSELDTSPAELIYAHQEDSIAHDIKLSATALQKGYSIILRGVFEDDTLSLRFDALKKVPGPSKLGDFHYIPIVFEGLSPVRKYHRLLLELLGFLTSRFQGSVPAEGIIWHGRDRAQTRVHLEHTAENAKRLLQDLAQILEAGTPPKLILNQHCRICEFQERCHAQAVQEDSLSLLHGISEREIARQSNKGIFTLNQLSYTFRMRRQPKRTKSPSNPHLYPLRALAIRENRVFVHGSPTLTCNSRRVYFDIEGDPVTHHYYLIGMIVSVDGINECYSYWAHNESEEIAIFEEMLDRCMQIQGCDFLHFGSYEQKALRKMRGTMTESYRIFIDEVLNHSINILSVISRHIYFPTYSNGLKDIATYLGCAWTNPNASGIQTVVWREQWQRSGDDHWKQKIVDYNLEDCWALKKVTEFIEQIVTTKDLPERPSDMPWTYTESLARHTHSRLIFENQQFADPDFDKINRCAYFDYQRNKVAARKNKNSKLKSRYSKNHTGALIKPNKIVKLALQRCPCCQSRNINLTGEKSKQITDIKFSRQAVKRWIVRYTYCVYKCAECGEVCKGESIPVHKSKFGTGLIAWCIYHNLVSGQNIMRIKQGLEDLFGLNVPQPSIYRFKQTFAQQCACHYDSIFERLLRSQFLYIDETPVNLRATKGYVWVMANDDSAYFFYRDSREGSFLADMLKSFNGVLISDFYTAYDSLNVKQQRCLIHLMRDFNEELLKNPFDGDLKEMTRHFSSVLTGIVDTIDRYGLRKRHLGKHKVPATRFLEWAIHSEFHSEVAKKFQDRIGKYKEMLFTFLDYDGISWNNNNAEHAIKSFARYRRFADGRFTKLSIKNYLVLLSIYQTCEYREEDFLDFLLGGVNAISF